MWLVDEIYTALTRHRAIGDNSGSRGSRKNPGTLPCISEP